MTTDNKTLADVQPGGRVRLGDQAERARFEAWVKNHVSSLARAADGEYASNVTHALWSAWQAALSAQPSPGGQGDALAMIGANLRSILSLAEKMGGGAHPLTVANIHHEADHALQLLAAALAARQPVRVYDCCGEAAGDLHKADCVAVQWSQGQRPAQAVDLGQFRPLASYVIEQAAGTRGDMHMLACQLQALIDRKADANG